MASWKVQFQVVNSPTYHDNAVRFEEHLEADFYALDKMLAWTACTDYRIVKSDDPANYAWSNGAGLVPLPSPPATPVKLSDLPGGTPVTLTWRTE
jgi:hypothetical protein